METSKKIEQAITLYQQRLENLTQIINDLHSIVKNDEIVNTLKDPSMEKYRIDRINEIVNQVLNSEKQKMLIRVLEKYDQISSKLKQTEEQTRNNKETNQNTTNRVAKQKNELQMIKLMKLSEEKSQMIKDKNKQIERLKQIIKQQSTLYGNSFKQQMCKKCQDYQKKIKQLELQKKISDQFSDKLKKDGQSAIKILNQKIKSINQKNQMLENQLIKKSSIVRENKQQITLKNDISKRNEKIQVMRRQIAFLEDSLVQVQKQFNIVKDVALGSLLSQFKKLKVLHKKLKQFCIQKLSNFSQQNKLMMQKLTAKISKTLSKPQQSLKPDRLMSKLNQLQNQLDYFLQNQVLVQ